MKISSFLIVFLFSLNGFAQEYSFIPKEFEKIEREEFSKRIISDTLVISGFYFENGKIVGKTEQDSINTNKLNNYFENLYFLKNNSNQVIVVKKRLSEEEKKVKDLKQKESIKKQKNEFKQLDNSILEYLELKDINGKTYNLDDLDGKIITLNFWFVKCKPCVAEIPELNKIKEKYRDKDVVFFAITFDSESILKEFSKKKKFDFTLIPSDFKTIQQFKIREYPTTIIIDKERKINLVDDLFVLNITKKIDKMIGQFLDK